jgi:perosamine synthetase
MLRAISRYGARVHPTTQQIVAACRERGEFIQGPQIAAFEQAFGARLGAGHAVTASHGRMALYFILRALQFPPGSEIVVPALTIWTLPEIARVAGLNVRFADVDPVTSLVDPASVQRAITDRTRAILVSHLYGLPCDMDAILDLAASRRLTVIEDCCHALGATYRDRPAGSLGDAAFFSFQTWKPLNCYGGGMAVVRDGAVAARVRRQVEALPWPHEKRVANRWLAGRLQRFFSLPRVFAFTGFPLLWLSCVAGRCTEGFSWEKPRRLEPLPEEYLERFSNVQAAVGLAGLELIEAWTAATRAHAHALNLALADLANVQVPAERPERTHAYHQYCVQTDKRRALVGHCVRRGLDIERARVDVCPRLDIFVAERTPTPGADRAAQAVQVPVYASLTDLQMRRIAKVVREALTTTARPPADTTC